MRYSYIVLLFYLLLPDMAIAGQLPHQPTAQSAKQVYQHALHLAAQGKPSQAILALQVAHSLLPSSNIWQERMLAASELLSLKEKQGSNLPIAKQNSYLNLAQSYLKTHPFTIKDDAWVVGTLATLCPGAGHAWQGRWQDAGVAALFVFPLLILTLWAAKRRMGPVTVFFAFITLWLWSGTIFSAISLAERGQLESYLVWWQQLWQASGLPGQPW